MEKPVSQYVAERVDIEDPVLLIRISQRYEPGMSAQELYEATRGIWKLSPRNAGRASVRAGLSRSP